MRSMVLPLLVVSVSALGGDRMRDMPLAPTPRGSAVPPLPGAAPPNPYWNLTTTLTEVTGRHVCEHWRFEIGRSVDWLLDVKRSGDGVTLVYDVRNMPTDHLELIGTVSGDRFEASSRYSSYQPCGGSRLDYDFESRVTGRFSSDGSRISAHETWSYRVAAGDALVMSFDWNARAPTAAASSR